MPKLFAPPRFGAWPFFDRLAMGAPLDSNLDFEILHNGVPRTFRDRRETALEAGQLAKSKAKGDIIELRDFAIGDARDAGIWRGGLAPSGV